MVFGASQTAGLRQSYLSNKLQFVKYNESESDSLEIKYCAL